MNDLLKLLAALATKQRGHLYIIDEMQHGDDWYVWFNADLDDNNPQPGTCDIYIQKSGTSPSDDDSGFCVVANAKYSRVLRFLATIGMNNLPEKSRKAYYEVNISLLRTEVKE